MNWVTFGTRTVEQAQMCKQWFEDNGIRTGGEIFELSNFVGFLYMPIGSKQRALCNKQIQYWIDHSMI